MTCSGPSEDPRQDVRSIFSSMLLRICCRRDIVHRKKMGFPTPLRQWLMDDRAAPLYAALRDNKGFLASIVNRPALEDLISRHLGGREDATDRLWRLLNLQLWGDLFLTGRRDRWWDGILSSPSPEPLFSRP